MPLSLRSFLAVTLLWWLSVSVMSQTKDSSNPGATLHPPFDAVNGGFLAVTVPDLDASAKWYAEKLGLKVVKEHVFRTDRKAAVTVLQGNGLTVELVWLAEAVPLAKVAPQLKGNHEIYGIFKSGIFVNHLDRALQELKARNVTLAFETFYDKSMNCRMFAIRDDNDNIIQFFGK